MFFAFWFLVYSVGSNAYAEAYLSRILSLASGENSISVQAVCRMTNVATTWNQYITRSS